jgi:hypothetical protein
MNLILVYYIKNLYENLERTIKRHRINKVCAKKVFLFPNAMLCLHFRLTFDVNKARLRRRIDSKGWCNNTSAEPEIRHLGLQLLKMAIYRRPLTENSTLHAMDILYL